MKLYIQRALLTLVIALAACSFALSQGLYWEVTNDVQAMDHPTNEKGYAMPGMFKSVRENGQWSLVLMDKQAMYNINDNDKTYWETTFAQLDSMASNAGSNMDAMQQRMKDRMANMTDDQKAMMQKMMGDRMNGMMGGGGDSTTVTKTAETKSIAGFDCTKYVAVTGKDTTTVWATEGIKASPEMKKEVMDFQKKISQMARGRGKAMTSIYSQINGFPMIIESPMFSRTVTKLEVKDIPSTEFAIPSDYKQVERPAFGGRGRRGGDNGGGDKKDNY